MKFSRQFVTLQTIMCRQLLTVRLVCVVFVSALAACEQQQPPSASSGTPVKEPGADNTLVSIAPTSKEASTVDQPEATPAADTEGDREEVRLLKLDIPKDILIGQESTALPQQPNRLPDLFNRPAGPRTAVSGRLLFQEGERPAPNSMDGAEITIVVPLES